MTDMETASTTTRSREIFQGQQEFLFPCVGHLYKDPIVMVNPKILDRSEELRVHEEGCLSIPEVTAEVERPAVSRVAFLDREGERQERVLEGLLSTIVQHEVDHLDGVLFIDYLSRLKRDMIVKKFTKQKRAEAM